MAPAEVVSEFIKLERADASKVVDMLKDIFEKGAEHRVSRVFGASRYPEVCHSRCRLRAAVAVFFPKKQSSSEKLRSLPMSAPTAFTW